MYTNIETYFALDKTKVSDLMEEYFVAEKKTNKVLDKNDIMSSI